jgi:hypothetical protein
MGILVLLSLTFLIHRRWHQVHQTGILQTKQQPTPSLSLEIPAQSYPNAHTGPYATATTFSPEDIGQLQTPMSPPAPRESTIVLYNSMGMARYLATDLESVAEDPNTKPAAFSASGSAQNRNIMRTASANPFEDPYPPTYAESLTHLVQASFSAPRLPYLAPPLPSSNQLEKS